MSVTEKKPEIAQTPVAQDPATEQTKTANLSKKTTGERYYGWLKFGVAEAVILAVTAVIAYVASYGPKHPLNIFRMIQDGFSKLLSPLTKMGKEGSHLRDAGIMTAGAATSTMVTCHGGNAFAPGMKWFEDSKTKIVDFFNKRFGKPGELEAGHKRLENEPRQTWGDVIKGRIIAWGIVFGSFLTAGIALGKDKAERQKPDGMFRFSKFEEGFGRWFAGLTKEGKELNIGLPKKTGIPLTEKLSEEAAKNRSYRFGKILALDIFATTAAIAIWNVISGLSAKKRHKEQAPSIERPYAPDPQPDQQGEPETYFADSTKPRERSTITAKTKDDSYAAMISKQQSVKGDSMEIGG